MLQITRAKLLKKWRENNNLVHRYIKADSLFLGGANLVVCSVKFFQSLAGLQIGMKTDSENVLKMFKVQIHTLEQSATKHKETSSAVSQTVMLFYLSQSLSKTQMC